MPLIFGIFNLIRSLFYTSTQSDLLHLSAEKIGLSVSHIVPEILGPKFGLIFHQNVLFNRFKHFASIFNYTLFNPIDLPFSFILDLFDPSFLQNLRSN